ncbi:MAG: carbon-nitrogen hydrolase family protein, partial [Dehalococcoidales bacterium]|nr:carbon-nitrogen hydrolase family protein [Dehalococcoidales bacterium]
MSKKVKIAAVQMDPKIMEKKINLEKMLHEARIAASNDANLIVFPECALSGYVYASREEAIPFMETIPGPSIDKLADCCIELGVYIIAGLLEIDPNTDRCFNTAILISPNGLIGKYRKNHLPFLGVDRFVNPGDDAFQVYQTPIGNIGLHICYDCNFPESARVMALLGADILALPTNWPEGREKVAKYVINTRAFENKVHLVAVDRVGTERGTNFIGTSKIIDAWGDTLMEASSDQEEIIYAEINLTDSRQKRIVFKPGEFEVDFIGDRRPEL